MINNIIKNIKKCDKCDLCKLSVNITTEQYIYHGKLCPKIYTSKKCLFFIVGLNPSRKRYEGGNLTIYDNNIDKSKFVIDNFAVLLTKLNIYHYCYITNLVKCSTQDNKVNDYYSNICFEEHLKKEIEIIKPKFIIALGNQVYNYLNQKLDCNVYKIKHPSYYLSYKKGTPEEQETELINLLKILISKK